MIVSAEKTAIYDRFPVPRNVTWPSWGEFPKKKSVHMWLFSMTRSCTFPVELSRIGHKSHLIFHLARRNSLVQVKSKELHVFRESLDTHLSWTYPCGSTKSDDKSSKLSEALLETTGEVDVPKGVRSHFQSFACDSCTLPATRAAFPLTVLDDCKLKAECWEKNLLTYRNCGHYW